MRVQRRVVGSARVDAAEAVVAGSDRDFQTFITEAAWVLWSRPGLDDRTRSLVTIALLAALGRENELALHLRASSDPGVKPEEVAGALVHVAVYAGIPAPNTAFRRAKQALMETPT